MRSLGESYMLLGNPKKAIEIQEQAYRQAAKLLKPDSMQLQIYRGSLSTSYRVAGRMDKSIELGREVLDEITELCGP